MDATPQRLTEFLTAYAPALTAQIVTQFTPLYAPTAETRGALIVPGLKRSLFAAQQDTVAALVAAFRQHRTLGLAGEPGFGKTFEGAWRRVARARAQVPRSAARCVPISGWLA